MESEIQCSINEKIKTEQLFMVNKNSCENSNPPKFVLVFQVAPIGDNFLVF